MLKQLPPEILANIFDFITYQKRDFNYFQSSSLEVPFWKSWEGIHLRVTCDIVEAFRAVANRGGNVLLFFFRVLEFYFFTERELTVQAYFTYRSFDFLERKVVWLHLDGEEYTKKKNQYTDRLINMLANKG
jgi:hypothetical protein